MLCSASLKLFLAWSSLFSLVTASSMPIRFLEAMTLLNVLTCKFTINQLQVRFYYKMGPLWCIKKWGKCCYKMEQFFVLKIGASGIRKLNNFYYKVLHRQTLLQSGLTITKSGSTCIVCCVNPNQKCVSYQNSMCSLKAHTFIQPHSQFGYPSVPVPQGQLRGMRKINNQPSTSRKTITIPPQTHLYDPYLS